MITIIQANPGGPESKITSTATTGPEAVMTRAWQKLIQLPITPNWSVDAADILIQAGVDSRAVDLHLECHREDLRVRLRIHGSLTPPRVLSLGSGQTLATLIGRLKVLARLPAYMIHEPQDGRLDWNPNPASDTSRPLSLRIAFLPTPHGCLITLRYPVLAESVTGTLDPAGVPRLDRLGMPDPVLRLTQNLVAARDGLVALTGPSGSGKTTTLHAILAHLNETLESRLQMIAIEDPVERELPFVNHVQIHQPTGLDFHTAARAALRHGPDVLLIGELRDPETVQVALSAGMSGHLVLTTIHAGRAWRVPGRLRAMGAPPHLIASCFNGAIAQRLATTSNPTQGQVALFEALAVDEALRARLAQPDSQPAELMDLLQASVSPTLEHQGQQLIESGVLTPSHFMISLGQAPGDSRS